jgi:Flp pilus assembly protein TadG
VLVTLLAVPLIVLAALAIDVSAWQTGRNQMQTGTDAAALAAARAFQTATSGFQTVTQSAATDAAARNTAFGAALGAPTVTPCWYIPPSGTNTTADTVCAGRSITIGAGTAARVIEPAWGTPGDVNAIRVDASTSGGLIFGGAAMQSAPTVRTSALAWIANIQSGSCIKPWALPYTALYDRIVQITGISSTEPVPPNGIRRNLSQEQLNALAGLEEAQRIIIFRPPTYDGTGGNPDSSAANGNLGFNNGMYAAYNFLTPSGNNNASTTGYQSNIFGCSTQTVTVSTTNGATLPGSNDIPCATVNALMGSTANQCQPNNASNWTPGVNGNNGWPNNSQPSVTQTVTCYYAAPTGTPANQWKADCYNATPTTSLTLGSMQNVAWGDGTLPGSNQTVFRMIGKLKVLCVFRGISAAQGAPSGNAETCSTGGATAPASYPQGTIVGVIQGLSAPVISPGTSLGNSKGDQQRLLLVRGTCSAAATQNGC